MSKYQYIAEAIHEEAKLEYKEGNSMRRILYGIALEVDLIVGELMLLYPRKEEE